MKGLRFEKATQDRLAKRRGTVQIRSKADAPLPRRSAEDDLPPEVRHRQKLNRVYKTLRLTAKAAGKKFPHYEAWLAAQPQV